MRQGKIEYLWHQICSWLNPGPPETYDSPYGEARLTLPLPIVAPLFLRQKTRKPTGPKPAVPNEIPDLFSVGTSPQTVSPEPAKTTAPTPLPATDEAAPKPVDAPLPDAAPKPSARSGKGGKRPANLAELFGEPNKRKWTPNDIVNKTVELPGVAGALIALQDGLLVAHCMPPGVKAETVGAFLPQIIGRMSQYAKEFQLGGLKSVTLTIDKGRLQIYHPGAIYFAALGRPQDELPQDKLDFIAAELSRRGK